jgi:hypothetical protein
VRTAAAVLSILLLVLAAACGLLRAGMPAAEALAARGLLAGGPVYPVGALEQRLVHHPGEWFGRTVLVQGRVVLDRTWSAPDSIVTRIELMDAHALPGAPALSLRWGGADPFIGAWRRTPVLGRLALLPQTVRWGTPATYRVRLAAAPSSACTGAPCFEAVLLDAAP